MKINHWIFDVDGLLLDTEPIYSQCFVELFQIFNLDFTSDLKYKIIGRREEEVARICVEEMKINVSIDDFRKMAFEIQRKYIGECKLMSGAEEVIRKLKNESDSALSIATSALKRSFAIKSKNHKLFFSNFQHITTGDAVINGKPSPDIYLHAAKLENSQVDECVVFEDSVNGVLAALDAGMQVVWVPDVNFHDEILKQHSHLFNNPNVHVIQSLNDFQIDLFK